MVRRKSAGIIWYVEYNFVATKWGMRAMNMMQFPTEEEAVEYMRTETTDGKLGWMMEV